ncbi:PTS glucose transporter subunit IIA [Pseudarthrobacter sp. AL07]|uniref:PTS sugar transporter subunit IIA n=1 Tax=unclassified Pseudarthrobacter TaxID=2647000 RepID=UPI00249A4BE9|nr:MULTISPECIES: PTS glucose transporter subunit IIA [unclassified Pseudarthrobacter]MDI3194999.1 PTS glucose transporter subunit IIA [Pseudarthrobacter sp. AL20]MDI3209129.1 PTS glucose transporter subunit IIA [Pseudarthrobacter sp. AL07]
MSRSDVTAPELGTETTAQIISVASPLPGRLIPLSEVPDPVFAKGLVGGGAAVIPDDDAGVITAVAPLDGKVVKVMPHAYIVQHASGPAVLVHVGIDTVRLKGEGFTVIAQKGDQVRAGDPMITVDVTLVRSKDLSMCSPVVILDSAADAIEAAASGGRVEAGARLFDLPGK